MRVIKNKRGEGNILLNEGKIVFPKKGLTSVVVNKLEPGVEVPGSLFRTVVEKDNYEIVEINNKKVVKDWSKYSLTKNMDKNPYDCELKGEKIVCKEKVYYTPETMWIDLENAIYGEVAEYYVRECEYGLFEPVKLKYDHIYKYVDSLVYYKKFYRLKGYDGYILHDKRIPTFATDFVNNGKKIEFTLIKDEYYEEYKSLLNKLKYFSVNFDEDAKKLGAFKKSDGKWYIIENVVESDDGRRGGYLTQDVEFVVDESYIKSKLYKEEINNIKKEIEEFVDKVGKKVTVVDLDGVEID